MQEVLLYKHLGQTERVGEFFRVTSSADFKQKLGHLAFHLLGGFTVDNIFVLIRFQNPRTLFSTPKKIISFFHNFTNNIDGRGPWKP